MAHEQSCSTAELLSLFVVAYEEQSRTEEIIRMCLPQIKSKHLLLSSFGNFEEENEQFRVSCLMGIYIFTGEEESCTGWTISDSWI